MRLFYPWNHVLLKSTDIHKGVCVVFPPPPPFFVFTVGQGLHSLFTSSASSIIDACKMLLFYLQLGGREPLVEAACGGLFAAGVDNERVHAFTHTLPHASTSHFTHAILLSPLPAALLNWGTSGSEMKLVNLDCFYDWLDMICIIIWTHCSFPLFPSFTLSLSLRSTDASLSPSLSFHYLDWLFWNRP